VHVASTTDRIHDRAAELGPASFGVVGDLTVESDVDRLLAAVGHVDVLVNNAGMVSIGTPDQVGPMTTTSYAEWRADLARNLDTAFLVTRRFLPAMVAAAGAGSSTSPRPPAR
jgi:3-oxoacyl-[acyl-carrier protein] reductase